MALGSWQEVDTSCNGQLSQQPSHWLSSIKTPGTKVLSLTIFTSESPLDFRQTYCSGSGAFPVICLGAIFTYRIGEGIGCFGKLSVMQKN